MSCEVYTAAEQMEDATKALAKESDAEKAMAHIMMAGAVIRVALNVDEDLSQWETLSEQQKLIINLLSDFAYVTEPAYQAIYSIETGNVLDPVRKNDSNRDSQSLQLFAQTLKDANRGMTAKFLMAQLPVIEGYIDGLEATFNTASPDIQQAARQATEFLSAAKDEISAAQQTVKRRQ